MFSKISKLSVNRFLLLLAYAGSTLFIWRNLGDTVREPKWILLQATSIFLILINLPSTLTLLKRIPSIVWLFLIFAFIHGAFFLTSRFDKNIPANILALLILAQFFLANQSKQDKLWQKYTLLLAMIPNAIWGLLQIFRIDPLFNVNDFRYEGLPAGFLGQHTFFGLLMCALALIWLSQKQKLAALICLLFILASASAFSLLSFFVGFCGWLIWKKKIKLAASLIAFSIAALFIGYTWSVSFFDDNGRYIIWRMLLDAVFERPLFGYGFGSFSLEFHTHHQGIGGEPWLQAHNEYLELLFDTGIVGLFFGIIVAALPFMKIKSWWRKDEMLPYFLVYICLLSNALGNFPFHYAPFALYGITSYLALWNADRPLLAH